MQKVFIPLASGPRASESLDVQCPHSARTVPATVPAVKKGYFGDLDSKNRIIGSENLLFRSTISKVVVLASGYCAGTVAGTIQETCLCRIGYMIPYDLDHFLGLPERICTNSSSTDFLLAHTLAHS